jgi:hypothetical protein
MQPLLTHHEAIARILTGKQSRGRASGTTGSAVVCVAEPGTGEGDHRQVTRWEVGCGGVLGGFGGSEFDGVAQGLELSGQLGGASGEVDAAGVEVGSQVGELGGGVVE